MKNNKKEIKSENNKEGQKTVVVIVQNRKSVGLSLILTFFFGPLGMLYSTITGGIIMFIVNLIFLPVTLVFGIILTWPIQIIWGVIAVNRHNSKIGNQITINH